MKSQAGDTATGSVTIGEPAPATAFSDVLKACGSALGVPERQLVIPVEVKLTLTSTMAARAGVIMHSWDGTNVAENEGSVSTSLDNCTNATNSLGWDFQPGQTGTGTVYYILSGAVSPNFPNGDPAKVKDFGVDVSIAVGDANGDQTWAGPIVTGCKNSLTSNFPTLTLMSPKPDCPSS